MKNILDTFSTLSILELKILNCEIKKIIKTKTILEELDNNNCHFEFYNDKVEDFGLDICHKIFTVYLDFESYDHDLDQSSCIITGFYDNQIECFWYDKLDPFKCINFNPILELSDGYDPFKGKAETDIIAYYRSHQTLPLEGQIITILDINWHTKFWLVKNNKLFDINTKEYQDELYNWYKLNPIVINIEKDDELYDNFIT